MKKAAFFFSLAWLLSWSASADETTPSDQFRQANQTFESGDLEKAAEQYNNLVARGFESADLYYNLGNLYYRKGERGKAVLWYERAQTLDPRDSDIQFNLSLAKSHIKEDESNFTRKFFLWFTMNEVSAAVAVFSWIFFGLIGMRQMGWINKDGWSSPATLLSGCTLGLTVLWFAVAFSFDRQPIAVVVTPPGEVRNGPGTDYAVGFTIPEGSNVVLLNRRPDWSQVGVTNQGLKGWMPNTDIEAVRVIPSSLN